jgi:hypothetical protein
MIAVSTSSVTGTYKDLADFRFVAESWSDAFSGPLRDYQKGARPGRTDTALLSSSPIYRPGEMVVAGTICAPNSTSYTIADLLTDIQNLKGWCARCVALKVTAYSSSFYRQAKLIGATVEHYDVPGRQKAARVALTFECVDPLWYSTSETNNAITTSLTEQALGTAPVRPVITVTGNPSAFSLTYANSAGTTVQTLALASLTTSGATSLVIDMNALTVVQTVSAVAASAVSKITTGDFFALDPVDADTVTPTWCKLLYTATGTVSAVSCVYRKAYF